MADIYAYVDIPGVGLKKVLVTSFGDDVSDYGSLDDVYVTLNGGKRALITLNVGGGVPFENSLQVATPGQTIFSATFNINRVYVDSVLFTTGYSGQGTEEITFDVGRTDGQEIYMTT